MNKKLIGKFQSNGIIDLGQVYCIDEAFIYEVKPTTVYYSLDDCHISEIFEVGLKHINHKNER